MRTNKPKAIRSTPFYRRKAPLREFFSTDNRTAGFEFLLGLFAFLMPLSKAAMNIVFGILILYTVFRFHRFTFIEQIKKHKHVLALSGVFLLYLFFAPLASSVTLGVKTINKNLTWLIIPLCMMAFRLQKKSLRVVVWSFISGVVIASLLSLARWRLNHLFQIHDIREITFVFHISHAILVDLALIFLLTDVMTHASPLSRKAIVGIAGIALFLFAYALFLHSLLGLFALFGSLCLLVLLHRSSTGSLPWINYGKAGITAFILLFSVLVGTEIYRHAHLQMPSRSQLPLLTLSGNRYQHDTTNRIKENGHFVGLYLCEKEVRAAWEQRSTIGYHEKDQTGFNIRETLIRYLTSKNLTKDSTGVSMLTDEEIEQVEAGFANFRYAPGNMNLSARIYQTIWEIDEYLMNGNPNDKSLIQRFIYANTALQIIHDHPFLGVSPAKNRATFEYYQTRDHPRLEKKYQTTAHNQYLNYMTQFGIGGFLLLIVFIWWPIYKTGSHPPVFRLFLWVFMLACLGDSQLETTTGQSAFVLFYSLLLITIPTAKTRNVLPD